MRLPSGLLLTILVSAVTANEDAKKEKTSDILLDEPIELQLEGFPQRPQPVLELGENPFFGTGRIDPGWETPTGAVFQQQFLFHGAFRSSLQTNDRSGTRRTEWVNRLDLNASYYLTPTERLFFSLRPLDRDGRWTGYQIKPESDFIDEIDLHVETAFFEGDFGELFPNLDPNDSRSLDYQFAIGRQPVILQDGIMFADPMDAVGVTRNSLFWFGANKVRASAIVGFGNINRADNRRRNDPMVYAISASMDYFQKNIEVDIAHVDADTEDGGDGYFLGLGLKNEIGVVSSTFRINQSWATDTDNAAVSTGTLITSQLSMIRPYTENIIYLNSFVGLNDYSPASRAVGGPLGGIGLMYAGAGIGAYAPALSNQPDESVGLGLGYQMFFERKRAQLTIELGGRKDTDKRDLGQVALAARFQKAFGRHLIWQLDGYAVNQENQDTRFGVRSEFLVKF